MGFSRDRAADLRVHDDKERPCQVANPRNAFCIEQRTAANSKEAQVRVFGLFLLLPQLAPVGLIAR